MREASGGKETSYLIRRWMLVTLGALGLGSLVIIFKLFQGDGKGRSTGLKVCWYKDAEDLPASGVMILMDCSEMTSAARYW
jgi:hypothetical protein